MKHFHLRRRDAKEKGWLKQRYFFFTVPYGLFYLVGGVVGYARSHNLLCILISGACGLVIFLLGLAHAVDHFRGYPVELLYISIPFAISLFVAVAMSCLVGLGSVFHTAGAIAIVAWIAVVFFLYAIWERFFNGEYRPLSSQSTD